MRIPDLSIVIPVYNEPENIIETIKEIKKKIKTKNEIIVVYDSNKDTTIPVLRKLCTKNKNILPTKNTIAKGPSGAIRTGIKRARSDLVLVTMADLCDNLSQVDRMVRLAITKADLVSPSRYVRGGKQELDAPLKVGFPKFAGYLLNLLAGIKTVDPTNSYKLYTKRVLNRIHLSSKTSFSVTLEIIVKTHLLGGTVYEIPTVWKDRQHGKTNFKLVSSLISYTPWFLLALFKNRLFDVSWIIRKAL